MILDYLRRNPGAPARQIAAVVTNGFETPEQRVSAIRRHLRKLRDRGLIEMVPGDPKNTAGDPPRYYVTGKKIS